MAWPDSATNCLNSALCNEICAFSGIFMDFFGEKGGFFR
jgi:hypothetical protein